MAARNQMQKGASRARDAMRRHEVLASGTFTGSVGGLAMLAVAMVGATSEGIPVTYPLQVIGESFVGPDAFDGGANIAFGALVHLATSVALGVLLAALVPRHLPIASAVGMGVGLALFALMGMMSLVVPWANPGFRSAMHEIGGTWVIAHALFGAAVGMSPALRRWLVHEASGASALHPERIPTQARSAAATTRTT